MKKMYIPWFSMFVLGGMFLPYLSNAGNTLTDSKIRQMVKTLINRDRNVFVQDIRIGREDQDLINLRINADIGICWGKKEFAKAYAKGAMQALFTSSLPLSHVILNILERDQPLLTVALGKNQASDMSWDDRESLDSFYERMRYRTHYEGNPADYCWLIERPSTAGP